jgi:hypothetical protein
VRRNVAVEEAGDVAGEEGDDIPAEVRWQQAECAAKRSVSARKGGRTRR